MVGMPIGSSFPEYGPCMHEILCLERELGLFQEVFPDSLRHTVLCVLSKHYTILFTTLDGTVVCLFFFFLFRATPAAYGNSQARGQIGVIAADLCHSHSSLGSEPCL